MLSIKNDRLPLAACIRLSPDEHGRQIILVKPHNRQLKFPGLTKMMIGKDGLTSERVGAINRALMADFVTTIVCADINSAVNTYLDLCDLLASTRAAARAERDAARREPALATGGAA